MIHLCTIATLMFLQNNTSQKILFIAARTIQFPGVVFKVCIYLIVAIVTSSLYFDVKSTHTLSKIYISNLFIFVHNPYFPRKTHLDCEIPQSRSLLWRRNISILLNIMIIFVYSHFCNIGNTSMVMR